VRETGPAPRREQVVFTFDLSSASGLFAAQRFEIEPGDVVLASESPMPLIAQTIGGLRMLRGITR
jgi:polysaccharide biosynthesis/export protein